MPLWWLTKCIISIQQGTDQVLSVRIRSGYIKQETHRSGLNKIELLLPCPVPVHILKKLKGVISRVGITKSHWSPRLLSFRSSSGQISSWTKIAARVPAIRSTFLMAERRRKQGIYMPLAPPNNFCLLFPSMHGRHITPRTKSGSVNKEWIGRAARHPCHMKS